MNSKQVFGTTEWAETNINLITGCSHDCKYCYAKSMAIRFTRKTPENWKNEEIRQKELAKNFRKRKGRIMFPSTHDITPDHLNECMSFLSKVLRPGNEVLIVSKPHLECIKELCDTLLPYQNQILFRFTIGSAYSEVLKFWEPGAPDFEERLESLKYAFDKGYQTSVSCEPMLEGNIDQVITQVSPFVTDAIWLGKMNKVKVRLAVNGTNDAETMEWAEQLTELQSDEWIKQLYGRYQDNPQIKWKESIKKVVGLTIPVEKGLDV